MTLNDLVATTGIESLHTDFDPDTIISGGYTSDLLSDVMGNAKDGCILITIQAHNNTVAVASLTGAACILVCGGRSVPDDMIASARRERIALFRTAQDQFHASNMIGKRIGV
jgi:predicted transcriptional regulator